MSLKLVEGNGDHATDAASVLSGKVARELAIQIEALAIRHLAQFKIPITNAAQRMQRIETKWDAPVDPREDALIYRTWFAVDGVEQPYQNVQVRLTGAHVFVETVMRAGLRP